MAYPQNKTQPTRASVEVLVGSLAYEWQRQDSAKLIEVMQRISGETPVLWGQNIIGFGTYRYKYVSGREGDWMKIGFAPRKAAISLYITCDAALYAKELSQLGKYKAGKGCIYIKRLRDVNLAVLEQLIRGAYQAYENV